MIRLGHISVHIIFSAFFQLLTIQGLCAFTTNCSRDVFFPLSLISSVVLVPVKKPPQIRHTPRCHLHISRAISNESSKSSFSQHLFIENSLSLFGSTCCYWIWSVWSRHFVRLLSRFQLNRGLSSHLLQCERPIGTAWLSVACGFLWQRNINSDKRIIAQLNHWKMLGELMGSFWNGR